MRAPAVPWMCYYRDEGRDDKSRETKAALSGTGSSLPMPIPLASLPPQRPGLAAEPVRVWRFKANTAMQHFSYAVRGILCFPSSTLRICFGRCDPQTLHIQAFILLLTESFKNGHGVVLARRALVFPGLDHNPLLHPWCMLTLPCHVHPEHTAFAFQPSTQCLACVLIQSCRAQRPWIQQLGGCSYLYRKGATVAVLGWLYCCWG